MSPIPRELAPVFLAKRRVGRPTNPDGLVLEAWSQGYMVGSLIIMACITIANMRKGVILHKLVLGIWQGFWIFFHDPIAGWWLSCGAIFLNASWVLHNVIAWMKIKPFLSRPASILFITTIILSIPYWVLEIYANFAYFHNINTLFLKTRPWEALCRDPWWILTTIVLFYNIKVRYELRIADIIRISPRFGVMMGAMVVSIAFIIIDVCSVTDALKSSLPVGINPFWKLAFVFKCLTDSVVLDDFKTALDRLRAFKISRMGSFSVDTSDRRTRGDGQLEHAWEQQASRPGGILHVPSPDGDYLQHDQFPGLKDGIKHVEAVPHAPEPAHMESAGNNDPYLPSRTRRDSWVQLHDIGHLTEESDYARVVKEMSTDSNAVPPTQKNFSRPSP
ncbi:uncharacterized protein BDZ99DRAFT_487402 [Mytilinidion resinicola]|uniref:Uncharacterized protein n=1 Tax=Mytilinidion resinicola TaxID=574789 RepID=A0A6A6YV50_9PEZI|nr:uncharacterized protein BDZ99DRAFT_487402 [Mytilinidion resinicola]KAF2811837.1 hypothetical protein BDZ99DRAFT_487402 [Mytilinidion resinicola]